MGERRCPKARPLFADLLRDLGAVPGIDRVRFTSPIPRDLRPETIAAMAETRRLRAAAPAPAVGSNRVLRAMRRGYTAERYLALLADARAAIKDLAVTTDIIVGFPGETAQDFERTLEVASQAAYDSAYTFIFSPRPGTRAAQMTRDVRRSRRGSPIVFERLKVVIERSALARNLTRGRPDRAGHRRGPVQEGPGGALGPYPPGQARATSLLPRPATSPRARS